MVSSGLLLITNIEDGHEREARIRSARLRTKRSAPAPSMQILDIYDVSKRRRTKRDSVRNRQEEHVGISADPINRRNKFPETWIWEEFDSDNGTRGVQCVFGCFSHFYC